MGKGGWWALCWAFSVCLPTHAGVYRESGMATGWQSDQDGFRGKGVVIINNWHVDWNDSSSKVWYTEYRPGYGADVGQLYQRDQALNVYPCQNLKWSIHYLFPFPHRTNCTDAI